MTRKSLLLASLGLVAISHASTSDKVLAGAKLQLRAPANYTPGYFRIGYPNGDLPSSQGVCTDVVIRSFRNAGFDLQRLIHEDMRKHFSQYPRRESKPDSNIDHRRVPNLVHFFGKFGRKLPTSVVGTQLATWKAGDIVFWKLNNGLDHCGIISDTRSRKGLPLVIHNINRTTEEDVLTTWKIVGHFRYGGRQ